MAESKKPKIVITADDLNKTKVEETVRHIQNAKEIVLVREVGSNTSSRDSVITIAVLTVAGLLGGFLTWATWLVLPQYEDDPTASNLQVSVSMTVVIALTLVLADSALNRSAAKLGKSLLIAVPASLALSFLMGYFANDLYSNMVQDTIRAVSNSGLSYEDMMDEFLNRNHLNRGLAWSLLGLAAGLTVGLTSLAIKRILITAAGGFFGAFVGGFLFDYFQGEDVAQITGLAVTGAAVGLSVSLLEQVTKSSWLEIVKGGMAGKQFILYQSNITIGSSPSANVTLIKDNAIPPIAAVIKKFGNSATIQSAAPGLPITVDGVSGFEHPLKEGSLVLLGSTEVRFREKAKQVNNNSSIRG